MADTISVSDYQKAVRESTQRKSIIRDLNAKIEAITKERDDLKAQFTELQTQFDALAEEHSQLEEEAVAEIEKLEGERDEWKGKYDSAPSEHLTELQRLKTEIRDQKHKDKFNEVARKLNVRPEALEDAWNLSQYKIEADDPDEGVITSTLTGLLESKRYLAKEETTEPVGSQTAPVGATPKTAVVPKRGPGADRGGPAPKSDAVPASTTAEAPRSKDPFRIA